MCVHIHTYTYHRTRLGCQDPLYYTYKHTLHIYVYVRVCTHTYIYIPQDPSWTSGSSDISRIQLHDLAGENNTYWRMQNNCTTSDRLKRFVFQRCRLLLVVNVKKKLSANMRHCTVMKRSLDEQLFCIRQYVDLHPMFQHIYMHVCCIYMHVCCSSTHARMSVALFPARTQPMPKPKHLKGPSGSNKRYIWHIHTHVHVCCFGFMQLHLSLCARLRKSGNHLSPAQSSTSDQINHNHEYLNFEYQD